MTCRGPSMCWRPRTRSSRRAPIPCPKRSSTASCSRSTCPIPPLDAERRMLFATTGTDEDTAEPVLTSTDLLQTQRLVRLIPVGEQVADAILKIVRSARPGPEADEFVNKNVAWGPSPRASQALDARRPRPRAARRQACRRRSTMCWRSPARCSAIAWRSPSRPAPTATPSTRDRPAEELVG